MFQPVESGMTKTGLSMVLPPNPVVGERAVVAEGRDGVPGLRAAGRLPRRDGDGVPADAAAGLEHLLGQFRAQPIVVELRPVDLIVLHGPEEVEPVTEELAVAEGVVVPVPVPELVVVQCVAQDRLRQRPLLGAALEPPRRLASAPQRREQDPDQQRDDRDDHQKLDERELAARSFVHDRGSGAAARAPIPTGPADTIVRDGET